MAVTLCGCGIGPNLGHLLFLGGSKVELRAEPGAILVRSKGRLMRSSNRQSSSKHQAESNDDGQLQSRHARPPLRSCATNSTNWPSILDLDPFNSGAIAHCSQDAIAARQLTGLRPKYNMQIPMATRAAAAMAESRAR